MRIIQLSDHPGEALRALHRQRQTAQEEAQARYEQALSQHRARVAAAQAVRDEARAQRRWLAWLRGIYAAWAERWRAPAQPVFHHAATDQEEILAAGMAGEQAVANALGRAFSDDWVLLRGYRNRYGEIDHLLLGPRGLFAMEVKHRNATVHVDGDDWRFDKYDRFGNLVQQGRITDRGGRSPSRQVNDSADRAPAVPEPTPPAGHDRAHRHLDPPPVRARQPPQPHRLGGHLDGLRSRPGERVVIGAEAAQLGELRQLIEQDHRFHLSHNGSTRNGSGRNRARQ